MTTDDSTPAPTGGVKPADVAGAGGAVPARAQIALPGTRDNPAADGGPAEPLIDLEAAWDAALAADRVADLDLDLDLDLTEPVDLTVDEPVDLTVDEPVDLTVDEPVDLTSAMPPPDMPPPPPPPRAPRVLLRADSVAPDALARMVRDAVAEGPGAAPAPGGVGGGDGSGDPLVTMAESLAALRARAAEASARAVARAEEDRVAALAAMGARIRAEQAALHAEFVAAMPVAVMDAAEQGHQHAVVMVFDGSHKRGEFSVLYMLKGPHLVKGPHHAALRQEMRDMGVTPLLPRMRRTLASAGFSLTHTWNRATNENSLAVTWQVPPGGGRPAGATR